MGQIEVYEFLKEQRLSGNHVFMTCREVEVACKERGFSNGMLEGIRGDLLKLELTNYLEGMVKKNCWRRAWRLKMKYVKKPVKVES